MATCPWNGDMMTSSSRQSSAMPVLGLLRFSFYGPTDTRQKHDSEADLAALYSPERMTERFHYFERIFLPSMRAQTDEEYRLVVISSQVMPKEYRDRLSDLLAGYPQAEVHFAESLFLERVARPFITRSISESRMERSATFRIDDDDALSCHFVRRLREAAMNVPERAVITFPSTLGIFRDSDGSLGIAPRSAFCIGSGLCRMNSPAYTRNPYHMMHGIVWKRFPTISDPTFCSSIQSFHGYNDTGVNRDRNIQRMKADLGRAWGRPGLSVQVLQKLRNNFPTMDFHYLAETFGATLTDAQNAALAAEHAAATPESPAPEGLADAV